MSSNGSSKECQSIHWAVVSNDLNSLNQLISDATVDLNEKNANGLTALHLSVMANNATLVSALLSCGRCRVDEKIATDGLTALHLAASYGFDSIIELILSKTKKINALDRNERTPLFLAINHNNENAVKILIEGKANVNINTLQGYSPLSEAIAISNENIVEMLLTAGAVLFANGTHILSQTVKMNKLNITNLILNSSADLMINSCSHNSLPPLICLAGYPTDSYAKYKLLVKMIARGADVNYASRHHSLIHSLILSNSEREADVNAMCFDYLLTLKHCQLNTEIAIIGSNDLEEYMLTPLELSLAKYEYKFAEKLIKSGAHVNNWNAIKFRDNSINILKLLYLSQSSQKVAHNLCFNVINEPKNPPLTQFMLWLLQKETKCESLMSLSRRVILNRLRFNSHNITHALPSLCLPLEMKKYIIFDKYLE